MPQEYKNTNESRTMELFSLNGLVATTALIFKVLLLFQVRIFSQRTSLFVAITLLFIIQNSIESLGFLVGYQTEAASLLFIHLYDALLCVICVALIYLATTAYETRYSSGILVVSILAALSVIAIQLSGQLIAGVQLHADTATSLPGPLYVVFLVFMMSSLVGVLALLLAGSVFGNTQSSRRCQMLLLGLAPLLLVGITIAVLRAFGVDASAAKLVPLATTFFIAVMLLDEKSEYVSLSIKWRTIWGLAKMKDVAYKAWCESIEEEMIKGAVHFYPESQRTAGEAVGISQSTVSRKLEKLDYERKT